MRYYSIKNPSITADFKQASLEGQPKGGGLYFPERIPQWDDNFIKSLPKLSSAEIGFTIMKPYVGDTMSDDVLFRIMEETLSFPFPLVDISGGIQTLELFHGPTLAFKDTGARFLSRIMGHFADEQQQKIVVLVATSGDTGGAVANAFHQVEGTEVIILYPSGKVSPVQEKQLTALGGNIHALEVMGDFDDCQRLVKQAFLDEELQKGIMLTSSNSINISRWLSQQVYYAIAYSQWHHDQPPVVCVPSGNFGNICAGLLAKQSGLPIRHFIAACNANRVFTDYLETSTYSPASSIATHSNAMDVGDPSNFIRILELFGQDHNLINKAVSSYSINDIETAQTIRQIYEEKGYVLDPHAAVAYRAIEIWQERNQNQPGFILGTAHPVKFPEVVEGVTGNPIPVPNEILGLMEAPKNSTIINPHYTEMKSEFLKIIQA